MIFKELFTANHFKTLLTYYNEITMNIIMCIYFILSLDFISHFRAAGGKMVDVTPEVERELKTELEKVAKQYGSKPGEDMTKFPTFNFPGINATIVITFNLNRRECFEKSERQYYVI